MQGSNASNLFTFHQVFQLSIKIKSLSFFSIILIQLSFQFANKTRYFSDETATSLICLIVSILPRFWFPATVCSSQNYGHWSAIALVSSFPETTTTKLLIPPTHPQEKIPVEKSKSFHK
jgi:hypothetical protein